MLKSIELKNFALTLLIFCLVCLGFISGTKTAEAATLQVIASNLENPRGIDFGTDGAIYVAESGTGGSKFIPSFAEGLVFGFGLSGAVTRIQNGKQERVIVDLPSFALVPEGVPVPDKQGSFLQAVGTQDIKFGQNGDVYVLFSYSTDLDYRSTLGSIGADMGQIVKFHLKADGLLEKRSAVADLVKYEQAKNPDGEDLYSNPYSLKLEGDNFLVADAGGNSLVRVNKAGSISLMSVFPRRTENGVSFQAVPTAVTIGSDGAYYVGQLAGIPYLEGEARIYRIVPGQEPEVYADGFTQIVGLDFDSKGNLYVLEYSTQSLSVRDNNLQGVLIKLSPDGVRKTLISPGEGLIAPTSLRVGPDDAIYISNYGTIQRQGQIVRIEPTTSVTEVSQ